MKNSDWQITQPLSAIIFDCDGTLSTIEGIDELARHNHVSAPVSSLTAEAMGKSGINPELYQKRLDLVYPHKDQVINLGQTYFIHKVADALEIIQIFKRLNKTIYLISAGLYPAVQIFGELLNIPKENIFAVDISFDEEGNYLTHEATSPLVSNHGKREIVQQLKNQHPDILFVGDGMNDLSVADLVTRFVGFGGVFYRQIIADQCEFYISAFSLAPLLPLSLTAEECNLLTLEEAELYQKGLNLLKAGEVKCPPSPTTL